MLSKWLKKKKMEYLRRPIKAIISSASAVCQNAWRWLFPILQWLWMDGWWGELPRKHQAWRADSVILGQGTARWWPMYSMFSEAASLTSSGWWVQAQPRPLRPQRKHTASVLDRMMTYIANCGFAWSFLESLLSFFSGDLSGAFLSSQ